MSLESATDAADLQRDDMIERAVALAERLLARSQLTATPAERRRLARLGRLIEDERGRDLVQLLTDDVLRIEQPGRAARRFSDVVRANPLPDAVGAPDRILMQAGAVLAPLAPGLIMPLVARRIREESRGVVLSSRDPEFAEHARRRKEEGIRLNVNVLGEAILSDAEADARMAAVRRRLARDDVDYVSVKISAICANLDPLAFEDGVERVSDRLRVLYRDALSASPPKFVNLDMEEFKDLELTLAAFMTVLDEAEFAAMDAGIVLQAYLPDSHAALERLGEWATRRHERSGGRIKIRLVKGANLAMERVDAETHGWIQAPYFTKAEVDASYKALLESAMRPEWSASVRVGLASHNLFDVAWALVLRDGFEHRERIEFEMLEGMAPAQARAVHEAAQGLLLYAPIVAPSDVDSSIAYLSRRLDENTAPENFLRALFALKPGTREFADQADRFRESVRSRHSIPTTSHREPFVERVASSEFHNEPDSDFTVASVREAALKAVASDAVPPFTDTAAEIEAVIAQSRAAADRWLGSTSAERVALLDAVATRMAEHRYDTIALMADEAGKTIRESDPEVSEAIDFARFYGRSGGELIDRLRADGLSVDARGVVVVVAPWNFPLAIPAGGVFAAVAAGNAVVLKPAPETRRVAWALVNQMREAGVPDDLVQYVACDDNEVGRHLVTHPEVATVVLTGSYDTAKLFMTWKPELHLLAETSGKNAMIITAAADIDAALRDLVRSAFGHAGQKCSAASLAIVEASVHDSPKFQRRLADAVRSLPVGWPSDPANMMGPLIAPPRGPLERALTTLDRGESWLVEPRPVDPDDSHRMWTPGVKLGVRPHSWFHMTECFGPVLGVMRARDLEHAIELQNATPYGLTGGIQTLDPEEIRTWLDRVEIGNAYVNRHITGAVVRRQPFGGWKRSAIGGGVKAGGPDYVLGLTNVGDHRRPLLTDARRSFDEWWNQWFSVDHDPSELLSERNVLRYRPVHGVMLRIDSSTDPETIAVANAAAQRCGVAFHVSVAEEASEESLVARLADVGVERLRALIPVSNELRHHLLDMAIWLDTAPISSHGRIELAHWLKEQAVSETTHRYGRLTASAFADRDRNH